MLTEGEKILVRCLKAIGMNEEDTVATMISLETVEQQDMLAEFLGNHMDATSEEVLREVVRILKLTDLEPIA